MRYNDLIQAGIPQTHHTAASTANQPVVLTIPAPSPADPRNGLRQMVWAILLSASAAPAAAATVTVVSGAVTLLSFDILPGTPLPLQLPPVRGESNTSVVITLPALGGTTIGRISATAAVLDSDGY